MRIRLKHGIEVALDGAPRQQIDAGRAPRSVALLGSDYRGLKASVEVAVGDSVNLGQTLLTDRQRPGVRLTAPAAGHVSAIYRGPRRRLESIVIDVSDDATAQPMYDPISRERLGELPPEEVRSRLLESGLWTALRMRPFGGVAAPELEPSTIFVTAIDTNPLAADPAVVLAGREPAFADGVTVLATLTGSVHICTGPGLALPALAGRARVVEFFGPHPAGLPGTHIARLAQVSQASPVWHIGYQDVIAIGELFTTGALNNERVIAMGGPGALRPRLLRTCIGSSLDGLLRDEAKPGSDSVAGSVFAHRRLRPETGWLGRYDTQVSILGKPESCAPEDAAVMRGMLPVEQFEHVWPFDAPVLPLLRALLTRDSETAQALGCLALAEEDLGICSWLCPTRQDYGTALRDVLNSIHSEAAA